MTKVRNFAELAALYPALTQRQIAARYGITQARVWQILADQGVKGADRRRPLADRLWSRVVKSDGCWEWIGGANSKGTYGRIWEGSKRFLVHRVAYELTRGPIPDGLTLDHLCKNTLCVRPDHLEPVPLKQNVSRAIKKVLCRAGHAYTPENTYYHAGRRFCRACTNRRSKEYHARKRARWAALRERWGAA